MAVEPYVATRLVLAVGLITALAPVRAQADSFSAGEGVKQTKHEVRARFRSSYAELLVTREFEFRGEGVEELSAALELPANSTVTEFRSRYGKEGWRRGSLLNVTQAMNTYEYLTRGGKKGKPDSGVVLASYGGRALDVAAYPIRPGLRIALEYKVAVPTCYAGGVHFFYYSDDAKTKVAPAPGRFSWVAKRGAHGAKSRCAEASRENERLVASQLTEQKAPLRAELGVVKLQSSGRNIFRVRVESAKTLAPIPRGAKTVFVVDASHSVRKAALKKQVELINAYVADIPDGRFEIVLTQRRAKRVFGKFVSATEVRERLLREIPRTNGSFMHHSLAAAGAALQGAAGPLRVVAFTDDLRASTHTVAPILESAKALPERAILHVVSLDKDREWARDDSHELYGMVWPRGGIALNLGAKTSAADTSALASHLVAPRHIDSLEVDYGDESTLSETEFSAGRELEFFSATEEAVRRAKVSGKLWSKSFAFEVGRDKSLSSALPALALGDDFLVSSEAEEMAWLARAVSEYTSYLVKPKGMKRNYRAPSLGSTGIGIGGTGRSSCGCCMGRLARRSVSVVVPTQQRVEAVRSQILPKLKQCSASAVGGASLRVDTTLDEVVEVSILAADNSQLATCAVDAAWDIRLPTALFTESQASITVPVAR